MRKMNKQVLLIDELPKVGKAQLEAQGAAPAIVEVALRFNFLFRNIAEVALHFYCAAISKNFSVNSAIIYIELNFNLFYRNVDKCQPFLANYSLFFCLKSQKCGICIEL